MRKYIEPSSSFYTLHGSVFVQCDSSNCVSRGLLLSHLTVGIRNLHEVRNCEFFRIYLTRKMEGFDPYHPIKISKIEVQGNERTRETYFQHAFSDSVRCQNISELHEHLSSVTRHLRDSGLFEGVEANIRICDHASQGYHKPSKTGSSYNIAVDITVKEVGIPQLKMESYIQTGLICFPSVYLRRIVSLSRIMSKTILCIGGVS